MAGVAPYAQFAVLTNAEYWVLDLNQKCPTVCAKAFGLPMTFSVCAGAPVTLWWFLRRNRSEFDNPAFRKRYGFMYRNEENRCWWEAVWAVQTVLLTIPAVFHHNIGPVHALLLMLLFLALSAVAQQLFKPYVEQLLRNLQLGATCRLMFTVWLVLHMFPAKGNQAAAQALGASMLIVDTAFVAWCIFSIWQVAHSTLPSVQTMLGWCRRWRGAGCARGNPKSAATV